MQFDRAAERKAERRNKLRGNVEDYLVFGAFGIWMANLYLGVV